VNLIAEAVAGTLNVWVLIVSLYLHGNRFTFFYPCSVSFFS
jgi:hypothetical protein